MSAWQEAEAEADRLDPRWRLHEIQADRADVPDDENACLVVAHLVRETERRRIAWGSDHGDLFDGYPPRARMNGAQLGKVRAELAAIPAPLLAEAHRLHQLKKGRFRLEITPDYFSTATMEQSFGRKVANWLLHEAYLASDEGRHDDALQGCETVLRMGRIACKEPFVTSLWLRHALRRDAIATLERILGNGELSDDALARMQTSLAEDLSDSSWLVAVRGERAGLHQLYSSLRAGKDAKFFTDVIARTNPRSFDEWTVYCVPSTALKGYPEALRHWNESVEIAKLPISERLARLQAQEARGCY
jgi:hypothetical protein